MPNLIRSRWLRSAAATALWMALSTIGAPRIEAQILAPTASALPEALPDSTFWRLVTDLSEPTGFFSNENFTSNEWWYGRMVAALVAGGHTGGAYIGVGPEQNFSYIAWMRPAVAFIVDIRRGAMIQHLMFKAVFELAPTRPDFVALLFARPRPQGITATSTASALWANSMSAGTDTALARRNYAAIVDRITKTHGFTLSADDLATLEHVYMEFARYGPGIFYGGGGSNRGSAGFAGLTMQTDDGGVERGFLASDSLYHVVRDLEMRNLVIPVVGDFAGPKAIRGIGAYLSEHATTVSAFYVSNVEQYLFGTGNAWARFYENVATLPVDSSSVFVRPFGPGWDLGLPAYAVTVDSSTLQNAKPSGRISAVPNPALPLGPVPGAVTLCPIRDQLVAYVEGRIHGVEDAARCVR